MLELEVKPPWPLRLPSRGTPDGTGRAERGVLTRLIHVDEAPIVVRAWQLRGGEVALRYEPATGGSATEAQLEVAIERMRFTLALDDDLAPFYAEFKRHPLLGPVIRKTPWVRPRRKPWPWQALAWAITAQLIESQRAAAIQRALVRRWGRSLERGEGGPPLRDAPTAEAIAAVAPAELVACDLAEKRALAMIRCARDVAAGRTDLTDPADDRRLTAIPEIGAWTAQVLAQEGRGEADSLPAGDLMYIKLVGRLAGLGRRATVEEVEDYFEPYAPYRGLAGVFLASGFSRAVASGPPLRIAA